MVKKHYSSQNFRVDHIRRLRLALEDHILAIKMQIAEEIDISESAAPWAAPDPPRL